MNSEDRIELAQRLELTVEQQLELQVEVWVRRWLACNPSLTPELQVDLAKDEDVSVRRYLAENPSLTYEVQVELSGDVVVAVRINLAQNPSLAYEAQVVLAKDKNALVRGCLAKNPSVNAEKLFPKICPDGTFIGYKKVSGNIVLELEILGDTTNAYWSNKCRTNKVKVLRALNSEANEFKSLYDKNFIYRVGEVVETECNYDRKAECLAGIHFFMTQKEAEAYSFR